MGFYEEISRYYDDIFPVGRPQLDFIKQLAGKPPAKVLDVACGSGGYSIELAREGYELTAVDLDGEMVRLAREKARNEGLAIHFLKCDMKEIKSALDKKFNCIFCIGNSIVHLGMYEEIQDALIQMYTLLEAGGGLILQIINYDRIIELGITELPVIDNAKKGLKFIRRYEYLKEKGIINFNTTLTLENNGIESRFENSVRLLPVKSGEMHRMLDKAGFRNIAFYGDFNFSSYDRDSYMLVVEAKK